MPPRSSHASSTSAAREAFDGRLDSLLAEMKARFDQQGESVGELIEAVTDMKDEIKTLRIAIDDIRAELEWTMRNHAPRREPAIGLPVKSLPKGPASVNGHQHHHQDAEVTESAESGRLF